MWDRPKTVAISQTQDPLTGKKRPVYNPKFERFIRECGVLVELCAPASGNQKGSVENLVKFVKNNFFFVRRFKNRADLERQLAEWLEHVNEKRPCVATGEIPADRLKREQNKLRSIAFSRDSYGIFEMRTVAPSSEVRLEGTLQSRPRMDQPER